MKDLRIKATNELPDVFLDSKNSIMNFSGVASPDDVFILFKQISDWIDNSKEGFGKELTCNFNFKYLNTESRKMVFEILKKLIKICLDNNTKLSVNWYFKNNDEDIRELGEEFQDILELPFTFMEEKESSEEYMTKQLCH